MAVPSYTTDLTLIHACDASSASWTEPTGFLGGAITLPETDYYIQNTGCLSKNCGTSTPVGVGAIYNAGVGITVPSPGAVMTWLFFGAPNTLATQSAGGLQIFVGSATSAFKQWYVRGSDTYPYGGWICVPVDPAVAANTQTGSPSGATQYFGAGASIPGPAIASKGNPFGVDVIRYGRCEARISAGSTVDGYATFSGFADTNDLNANRWGLIQSVQGGYLIQGLVVFGYSSATDFRDSNKTILIANTEKVVSSFNAFEARNAFTRIDLTNISFTALGTVARGNWITTDNADINIDTCTFSDMGTFGFQSNSTIVTSTFRRCNLVTQNSAVFTGCTFDKTNDSTKALLSNNPSSITNCTFISSGTKHGIELTSACAGNSYSLSGNTFTGYAATDGNTGNECIYNNSGGAVTLNLSSGTSPSIRNGAGATTSVLTSCTLSMTVKDEAGDPIVGAFAYIDNNNTSPFILNTTTDSFGVASVAYSGSSVSNATWRVRKYGYKDFEILIDITGSNINLPVTLVADSLQV